jgi:putative membrane protein
MSNIISILIVLIAIEHAYFLVLEMFLWTKPQGIKAFSLKSKTFAEDTKVLAANQGLYNGFLAAGLIFGLLSKNENTLIFFLTCIITAGLYGAYSTKKIRLFNIQSLPSLLCLLFICIK